MNPKSSYAEAAKNMIISILSGLGIWMLGITTVSIMVYNKVIGLYHAGYGGTISIVMSAFITSMILCKKQTKNKIIYVVIGTALLWLIMFLIGKGIGSGNGFLGAILPLLGGSAAAVLLTAKSKKSTSFKYNKIFKW